MNRLARLLARDTEPVPGNRLQLLAGGAEFFPALIADLDAATREILLETYIFNPDASGRAVRDALARAARRGVNVSVLVDGLGTRQVPESFFAPLHAAGVALLTYRPLRPGWRLKRASLRRLHRKIVVIDARIAYVGGMNLIDDYAPVARPLPRFDLVARVEGPVLIGIQTAVRQLWWRVALTQWRGEHARSSSPAPSWRADGHARVAFLVRDNVAHRHSIERAYRAAFALARRRIDLASAYFLPGRRLRRQLLLAAARGVEVRLLLQGASDHPFYRLASQGLYRELLAGGVQIFVYDRGELHAKAAVVDDDWATVGSANLDPFSLLLAREANLVTDAADFCSELRVRLESAMAEAQALHAGDWARRGWSRRLAARFAYVCVRLLTGLAGFARWA